MLFCITISLVTTFLYIFWVLNQIFLLKMRRDSFKFLGIALSLSWLGVLFEVFDFPPIFWVFDSHSIFHLFIVPTPFLWAEFVIREAWYEKNKFVINEKYNKII